jgi:hypothetical protein
MKIFKATLTLLFLFAFASLAAAQCVAPPAGMTNWWPADGNAFDIVGGNHGILQGNATFGDGMVNQAFDLDGNGDYVQVNDTETAAFNFEGSFTIDAWINLEAVPAEFAPIVSKWNDLGVNQRSYFLAVQNVGGSPRLRFDVSETGGFLGGQSSSVTSTAAIPLNTWTHVAAVFDAGTGDLRLYINGDLAALIPQSVIVPGVNTPFENDEPLLIGAGDLGGNVRDFFNGLIDEVELFDRALTEAEIETIFEAGEDGKAIPVVIDVKPGDDGPSPINLKSKGKVPVAILSTETFDATTLDVESIVFAGANVNRKNNGNLHYSFEDVNGDGLLDLVLHFNTQDLDLTDTSTEAILEGTTEDGRCISATVSIKIVPSN